MSAEYGVAQAPDVLYVGTLTERAYSRIRASPVDVLLLSSRQCTSTDSIDSYQVRSALYTFREHVGVQGDTSVQASQTSTKTHTHSLVPGSKLAMLNDQIVCCSH